MFNRWLKHPFPHKKIPEDFMAINQQLKASEQQLKAINQQLRASNERLKAREQQLSAANQQLSANEQQLRAEIAERKRIEESLRESEQKIRAVFDQTFQFIGMMTLDGTLIEANRSALEFAGITEKDVLGKPFWETPWWTHSPELQEKLRRAVKDVSAGVLVRFEATHRAQDETLHYIDFSLKPIKDENGKVKWLIPEGRDITEYKKLGEEAQKRLQELEVFHKASIGREERIIELKKEIEKLKNDLRIAKDKGGRL